MYKEWGGMRWVRLYIRGWVGVGGDEVVCEG